jgi:hypothetical protein
VTYGAAKVDLPIDVTALLIPSVDIAVPRAL